MRQDSRTTEREQKITLQQRLADLVQKAVAMVEVKGTRWQDVANFINMRLADSREHLTEGEVQLTAEESSNVRYDRLVAAAVARAEEKYWQDVTDFVDFQVETFQDELLSIEHIKEMAAEGTQSV